MNNQDEYRLQTMICQYLSIQYPNVLFLSDTKASVKLTMPQAVRNKKIQKEGFKCPDLMIIEPKWQGNDASIFGLFLELKKESPFKKDGSIKASQNDHLKLQNDSILSLRSRGYYACFVWTFEQAKETIDWYLKGHL